MTGMNFLLNAFTESSSMRISYHMESMGKEVTQLTFTCSKPTIETLEVWNMFKVNYENIRKTSMTLYSTVFIVYFKQVNVSWVNTLLFYIRCVITNFSEQERLGRLLKIRALR